MPTRNVPVAQAGPRVADVMLRRPRTLTPATTVAEARRAFENPRERLLLVTRGDTYVGAVDREALAQDIPDDTPLARLDLNAAQVGPDDPVAHALDLLDVELGDRLPVVAADDRLVGLVCFNRRQGHFCVDARDH